MDATSTYYGINILGLEEMNPLANLFFTKIGLDGFILIKLAIAITLITIYILSMKRFSKLKWSMEKSLQIGSLGSWTVVSLNLLMIFMIKF